MSKYHFECRPEECLLFNFHIQTNKLQHHSGRGAVCQHLSKNRELIGLIDEDPGAKHHPYFKRLMTLNRGKAKFGIKYCIDRTRGNSLIILKPKFEDWIINAARLSRVRMADFNLSDDPNTLHGEINFKIGDLQRLIHQLRRDRNPALAYLATLL